MKIGELIVLNSKSLNLLVYAPHVVGAVAFIKRTTLIRALLIYYRKE